MTNNPFTPAQREALAELRRAWPERRIVLIGASALACQIEMRWRRTNDIDLTIVAEQRKLTADLGSLGWQRDKRLEQRWTSPQGVLVDALPTSHADVADGELIFAESGHVMNLAGFDLALTHYVRLSLDPEHSIDVATVPVVVILKMAAWLDRPAERERDLQDLAHLLNEYLEPDAPRRWSDEFVDARLDYENQSAFALGRDIAAIASELHRRLIGEFLDAVSDDGTAAHIHFARSFGHENPTTILNARLHAFRQGLGE